MALVRALGILKWIVPVRTTRSSPGSQINEATQSTSTVQKTGYRTSKLERTSISPACFAIWWLYISWWVVIVVVVVVVVVVVGGGGSSGSSSNRRRRRRRRDTGEGVVNVLVIVLTLAYHHSTL
jgi:ABC-type Fe3+ transport system permease subunit